MRIVKINQVDVDFTGEYSSLIVIHQDKPGWWPIFPVPQRLQCEHRLHEAFGRKKEHRLTASWSLMNACLWRLQLD